MYHLFPKFLWSVLLVIYSIFVLAVLKLCDIFDFSEITALRFLALVVVLGATYFLGASFYYSGWRIIWRKFPILNKLLFPDLNGIWLGSSDSNWPVIRKMKDGALSEGGITEEELEKVSLQRNDMAVEIKASLFKVKVLGKLSATNGDSYSIISAMLKKEDAETVNLAYIYEQSIPDPKTTDQDMHIGAANLAWNTCSPNKLEGVYWTRRNWRQGLNTAGLIYLQKVADKTDPEKSLKDYLNN